MFISTKALWTSCTGLAYQATTKSKSGDCLFAAGPPLPWDRQISWDGIFIFSAQKMNSFTRQQ